MEQELELDLAAVLDGPPPPEVAGQHRAHAALVEVGWGACVALSGLVAGVAVAALGQLG